MCCTDLESNMLRAVPHFVDVADDSSLCLFKQCTVEVRRGVETISTRTLISVLDRIGWSASRPGRFARGRKPHLFCWIGGWKVCS
jgi:hypothetical protein